MYKAVYSYSNSDNDVHSFQLGDEFNLIEQIDEHWWMMVNEKGIVGLVPASYLEINEISQEAVLKSISQCISAVEENGTRKPLSGTDRRNLQKLVKSKETILTGNSFWKSPDSNEIPQQPKRMAPQAPKSIKRGKSSKRYSAPLPPGTAPLSPVSPSSTVSSPSLAVSPSSFNFDEESNTNEGASSKIYNIQVSKGDVSPMQTKEISMKRDSSSKASVRTSSNSSPYMVSITKSENGEKRQSSIKSTDALKTAAKVGSTKISDEAKLTHLKGKNITLSKTEENSFTASKSIDVTSINSLNSSKIVVEERSKQQNTNGSILGADEMSVDTVSSNSFASTSIDNDFLTLPLLERLKQERDRVFIPDELGEQLIDAVRARCKISYNKSLAAVRCVLHTITAGVPSISSEIRKIEKQIQDDNLKVHYGSLAEEDISRLRNILDQLREHKEDAQQRNWAVHEDFVVIKELLDDLITTLDEIDPSICRMVLQEDECRYINDLILYYQMESRSKLRVSLLHVFGCFCQFGAQFVSALLCSVLPTELAQDLMQDQTDIMKFLNSCLMLTMIFSTAESVPYHHYVQFNETFINFVLDKIEDPPDSDSEDQAADGLVAMLLSFNQHFKAPRHNIVMQCLSKRSVFRTLSEKILLLLNRETDPVALFKFIETCPDSVLKFLIDIFAAKETSGIFFTNDFFVLIDIILRQIVNRSKKDKIRTEYLSLFHSMLNTTEYHEHRHRASEFKQCFVEILTNRDMETEVDVYIVKEIMTRFNQLFE